MAALALFYFQAAEAEETVRFGVDAYSTGAQIWIAKDKGYFAAEGIAPEVAIFATGIEAIDAALIGKKIGIATGTAEHLITMKYLEINGISAGQVEIVGFTSLIEMVASLRSGRIDASFVWADGTEKAIQDGKHYVLVDDSAAKRSASAYLVAAADFTRRKPAVVAAVLRAMNTASNFIHSNPDEAAAIIANRIHVAKEKVLPLMKLNEFNLSLGQYERVGFDEVAGFLNRSQQLPVTWDTGVDSTFLKAAVPSAVNLN